MTRSPLTWTAALAAALCLGLLGCRDDTPSDSDGGGLDAGAPAEDAGPDRCGDGTLDPGEACDTAIASGAGVCPMTCDDADACTADSSAGVACGARCEHAPITACADGDGCCAPGCASADDDDCAPPSACGDGVTQPPEQCDDGNDDPTDGCHECRLAMGPPTDGAYRISAMSLADPHAFTELFSCMDVTDVLNGQLDQQINTDQNGDTYLDLSNALELGPVDPGTGTGTIELSRVYCFAAMTGACAKPAETWSVTGVYRERADGVCLDARAYGASVERPYGTGVPPVAAPCFVSDAQLIDFDLYGIPLRLNDARIAGRVGPGPSVEDGLIRGFITEGDAAMTLIPSSIPVVGGSTLASILRGGPGNCELDSDMDTHPTLGPGWWFFLRIRGEAATLTVP